MAALNKALWPKPAFPSTNVSRFVELMCLWHVEREASCWLERGVECLVWFGAVFGGCKVSVLGVGIYVGLGQVASSLKQQSDA